MYGQFNLLFSCRLFQALDVPRLPDGGREVMRDDSVFLAFPDTGHEQNAGPDTGAAQGPAFGGVGDSEPGRTRRFERQGAFDGPMPIAVGLDHSTDRDGRADMLLDGVKIFSE